MKIARVRGKWRETASRYSKGGASIKRTQGWSAVLERKFLLAKEETHSRSTFKLDGKISLTQLSSLVRKRLVNCLHGVRKSPSQFNKESFASHCDKLPREITEKVTRWSDSDSPVLNGKHENIWKLISSPFFPLVALFIHRPNVVKIFPAFLAGISLWPI